MQTRSFSHIDLFDLNSHGLEARKDVIPDVLANVRSFDWSGKDHLLVSDGSRLFRVDVSNGKSTELLSEARRAIVGLAQCATGAIVINLESRTGNRSGEIWRLNPDGSNPTRLSNGQYDMSPACSPNGKWVYYLDGMQLLKRVPTEGGKSEAVGGAITNLDRVFGTLSFSPRGNRMLALVDIVDRASNRAQPRLAIFDLQGGTQSAPRLLVPNPNISAGSLYSGGARFSADGNSVVYAIKTNGVGNLWIQPLDGSSGRVAAYHPRRTGADRPNRAPDRWSASGCSR